MFACSHTLLLHANNFIIATLVIVHAQNIALNIHQVLNFPTDAPTPNCWVSDTQASLQLQSQQRLYVHAEPATLIHNRRDMTIEPQGFISDL